MKANEHPNPADLMYQKLVGYIYDREGDNDLVLVFERHLLKVDLDAITIKSRDDAI